MKFWAAILLLNIIFFFVQPVFASAYQNNTTDRCCPESNKEKKECPKNCNPFSMCMYCQYVPAKNIKIIKPEFIFFIKHHNDVNVNIVSGYRWPCWHPPNA